MKIKRAYLIEILIWILVLTSAFVTLFVMHFYFIVHKNSYNLYFNDVDGVIQGSPVRFMGTTVGHVRKLKYNPATDKIYTQILITKKDVKIPDGSKAKVEFTGIVGSKSIEIMPPETQERCQGIIAQSPLRIKDLIESFKMYNRALAMMEDGLDKFSAGNADIILKKLANPPDFTSFDDAIDNGTIIQKKFRGVISSYTQSEQEVFNKIDNIESGMKRLKRHPKP